MNRLATSCIGLLWTGLALGAATTVQCQVKGQGPDRDRALQQALVNAVAKVHGAAVGTSTARIDLDTGQVSVDSGLGTGRREVSVDRVAVQAATTLTYRQVQGLVRSYEVVSETTLADGTYEVTADVWVLDYQSPEDDKPIRLAVSPVTVTARACRFGPALVPPSDIARQLTQLLSGALADHPRFTLLDRQSEAAVEQERRLLDRADVKPAERSRLQATQGADYLVVVTVPQAELLADERVNPAIGVPTRRFDARVRAEFRLIVGPTRQLRLADDVRLRLEDNQVKALAERWRRDEIDYDELRLNLLKQVAARIAGRVVESLVPTRIAAVTADGQVILNQGGDRFVPGDRYQVFRAGQAVVDPETQEVLAQTEGALGVIRIERPLERICYAAVESGQIDPNAVGAVCRRLGGIEDRPYQGPGRNTTRTRRTETGGVRLPFD